MKSTLSSLELFHLVRELQPLVGARFDKAYQGIGERKRDMMLLFHKTGGEKFLLRILLPGLAYLTEQKPAYEKLPGDFAIFLRRHVGNSRVIEVRQRGFERIFEFVLENKDGRFTLLIELLPPGEALLLNAEGKIINLLEPKRLGQRVLRGGALYEPPPQQFDTVAASEEGIAQHLFSTAKDSIVKAIATDLGLGGDYAEEACARAGIAKSRKDLSKQELAAVASAVKTLFGESQPCGSAEEVFPIVLKTKNSLSPFTSFSHAIEQVAAADIGTAAAAVDEAPKRVKMAKAEEVLKQQEIALQGFLKSAEENQRKGELLYEHYRDVELLLAELREARKTMPWDELKQKVANKRIVKIDEQKGEVTLELD